MNGVEVTWRPPQVVEAILTANPGVRRDIARLADAIVADARRLVPVDTGALKGTIRHTGVDLDGTVDVVAGDATVDYAGYVEYGTGRGPAQPYMRPAVHKNRGTV